jgi:DNA-binding CsgD family transcriptional regulator
MSAAIGRFGVPPASRSRFGVSALTSTERRVVGLVADGKANAEIAGILGVSRRTVESHVSAAYRKLDVTSRVAMARIAMKHRIGS